MTTNIPAVPRHAATVILTRENAQQGGEWQCFMVRRPATSDFAADVYVFPGGKVDESDRDPEILQYTCHEPLPAGEGSEGPIGWVATKLAAVRELFEEAGVLLADRGGSALSLAGEQAQKYASYRDRLQRGDISLLDLARAESLRLRTDLLYPFAHWITPAEFPRRYDTWFFVTRLPDGQEPLHHVLEVTDGVWISPGAALDAFSRGEFPLVFATEKQLERMAMFDSDRAMLEATTEADLREVRPKMVRQEGEMAFLLPGDPGYS